MIHGHDFHCSLLDCYNRQSAWIAIIYQEIVAMILFLQNFATIANLKMVMTLIYMYLTGLRSSVSQERLY